MTTETRHHRLYTALISMLFAETIAALVWAGGAAARLHQLEIQVFQLQELNERTARVEEQSKHIITSLERIEGRLIEDAAQ